MILGLFVGDKFGNGKIFYTDNRNKRIRKVFCFSSNSWGDYIDKSFIESITIEVHLFETFKSLEHIIGSKNCVPNRLSGFSQSIISNFFSLIFEASFQFNNVNLFGLVIHLNVILLES